MTTAARESYVTFLLLLPEPGRKTKTWEVRSADDPDNSDLRLGNIKWFGRWRCYALFPDRETVFERHCLRDIADFCERETRAHMEAARATRRRSDSIDTPPSPVIP